MNRYPFRHNRRDHLIGYLVSFLLLAAIVLWLLATAEAASAGHVVRSVCAPRAVYSQAAVVNYLPAYYQVGSQLQAKAQATHSFRQSDEWLELQQLRAYHQAVQDLTRPQLPAQGEPTPGAEPPAQPQTPPEPAPHAFNGQLPAPQADPRVEQFVARYPTLGARCASCHAGAEPKGGFDVIVAVTSGECEERQAIAASIVNHRMPKGRPLPPEEQYLALRELFAE